MLGANLPPQLQPLAAQILSPTRAGAILIGSFVSVGLCGALVAQAAVYFSRFRRSDRPIFQVAVGVLLLLNLLHSAVTIAWEYNSLIANYSDIRPCSCVTRLTAQRRPSSMSRS